MHPLKSTWCLFFCILLKLSNMPIALFIQHWGGADIGEDPGYKTIPGSSWQMQEVTATSLARCPTAVKWCVLQWLESTCLEKKRKGRRLWHHSITDSNERYGARRGDTLYCIRRNACTCTMNARIQATKYAQSQMPSCCSCQCHLCRRGHTEVRTMELYETEALSMSLAPHEALCCHFHVCTIGNGGGFQLIIWAIKPEWGSFDPEMMSL